MISNVHMKLSNNDDIQPISILLNPDKPGECCKNLHLFESISLSFERMFSVHWSRVHNY